MGVGSGQSNGAFIDVQLAPALETAREHRGGAVPEIHIVVGQKFVGATAAGRSGGNQVGLS